MKLSKEALLEIVAIFQEGLLEGKDMSQALRDLDLEIDVDKLNLTREYVNSHPRAVDSKPELQDE
jgi:hypothetical protein